jgi:hypothetical protein
MRGGDKEYVRQDETVETVLGMTEDEFRRIYGWTKNPLGLGLLKNEPQLDTDGKHDIFSGKFYSLSLRDLKGSSKVLRRIQNSRKRSRFFILFHDPKDEKKTDVRGLMSNPDFNGATFQFASTMFGPLEGGKFDRDAKLETMYNMAVQGEFASISTIGAALNRKYILPSEVLKDLRNDPRWGTWSEKQIGWAFTNRMYALENFTSFALKDDDRRLGNRLPYTSNKGKYGRAFHINPDKAASYIHKRGDRDRVKIPIHQNVKVQFGNVKGKDSPSKYYRRAKDEVELIEKHQRVTCVLSSTIDLREGRKTSRRYGSRELRDIRNVKDLQRVLQEAAYYGAVYGAAYAGSDKVVLTMVGGGSFRNDPSIIYRAIEKVITDKRVQPLGIDIYLNYRYDSRREEAIPGIEKIGLASLFALANNVKRPFYSTNDYIDDIVSSNSVRGIVQNLHQAQGIGPGMLDPNHMELVEPEEVVPFRRPPSKKKPLERERMTSLGPLEPLKEDPEKETKEMEAENLEVELRKIVIQGLGSVLLPNLARKQFILFVNKKLKGKKKELKERYEGPFSDTWLDQYISFLTILVAMGESFLKKYRVMQKENFDDIWNEAENYLEEHSKHSSGKIEAIPFNLKSWLE